MKDQWGLLLCDCQGVEAGALRAGMPKGYPLREFTHGATVDDAFAESLRRDGMTRVVAACRDAQNGLAEALEDHLMTGEVRGLDLAALAMHAGQGDKPGKAARLARGALWAAERGREGAEHALSVGERVVLYTYHSAGLALAQRLAAHCHLTIFAPPGLEPPQGVQLKEVLRATLAGVEGRLGAFQMVLETPVAGSGGNGQPRGVEAHQIVLVGGPLPEGLGDQQGRTGLHLMPAPPEAPEALDAAASGLLQTMGGLTGDFMKPEAVHYDEAICAGGTAGQQTCGACINNCPYHALTRQKNNPLRIAVDHLACEGCGGCTAVCPTGAMRFNGPSPTELSAHMAGLLSTAGLDAGADNTVDMPNEAAQPPVLLFHCPEQGRAALTDAAREGWEYPAQVLPLEVPCLRYVNMGMLLAGLRMGAAGVGLLGCNDCLHGARETLEDDLELTGRVLDALGGGTGNGGTMGAGRVRLFTTDTAGRRDAIAALGVFAGTLTPSPIPFAGGKHQLGAGRAQLGESLRVLMERMGREPGGIQLKPGARHALALVDEQACTLCRSCATVCPTHAFMYSEQENALSFKHIDCVACGLCATACPEEAITLRPELYLEQGALEYQEMARDEMVGCARCEKPYINRKALDAMESRLLGLPQLLDTFTGNRKNLLRLCPDCRAVAAMWEVDQGWEP